jgi:hypothetical protein
MLMWGAFAPDLFWYRIPHVSLKSLACVRFLKKFPPQG